MRRIALFSILVSVLALGFATYTFAFPITPVNGGGTGTSTTPGYGQFLVGNKLSGYDYVSTSSLGAVKSVYGRTGAVTAQTGDYTTTQVTEGATLYWTQARFDNALTATTSLPKIVTLSALSLPYSQLTGTPDLSVYFTLAAWFATTTQAKISSLPSLSLPYAQITGVPAFNLYGWPYTVTSYGESTSTIVGFTNGIIAQASSTITNLTIGNSTTTNSTTTTASFTNASTTNLTISGVPSALLGTDIAGRVISTTTIKNSYLQASGVTPGTYTLTTLTVSSQGIITAASNGAAGTAASSTLLIDNNTFAGFNTFSKALTLAGASSTDFSATHSLYTPVTNALIGATVAGQAYAISTTSMNASITGNAGTATALAANGTNCPAGFMAGGVDASGNAESCTYVFATSTVWSPNNFIILGSNGQGYTIASSSLDLPNTALQNSSVTINSIGELSGGGSLSLGGTVNLIASTSPSVGQIFATSTATSTFAGGFTIQSQALTVEANNGFVGVNTAAPGNRFVAALGTNEIAQLNDAASASGIWGTNGGILGQSSLTEFVSQQTTPFAWFTGATRNTMTPGTERARLTTGGLFGLATTTPNGQMTVASSTGPQLSLTDANAADFSWVQRTINNNLYFATSTYGATSTSAALAIDPNGNIFQKIRASLLATDVNGQVIATTTIADSFLQNSGVTGGSYTNANITVNAQGIVTLAANGSAGAASSTLLIDFNTWLHLQTFAAASTTALTASTFWIPGFTSYSLTGNDQTGKFIQIATSTAYGTGTAGQVLTWANGVPSWQSTSTCAQITGSATLCDGSDNAASSTILGDSNTFAGLNSFTNAGTTSWSGALSLTKFNISATSSGSNGINLNGGCFAIAGVCIGTGGVGGGVSNVSTDSTLTGGPITTTGTLGLNLGNSNVWSVLQRFAAGIIANATSTIGDGAQGGGLTIYGGATTTGTQYIGGTLGVQDQTPDFTEEIAAPSINGFFGVTSPGNNGVKDGDLFAVMANGRIGVGSSTPWAAFSIASSSYNTATNNNAPVFAVATSSTPFGWLLGVWATSTFPERNSNKSAFTSNPGVRFTVGTESTYDYSGLLDQVTVNGRINTLDWHSISCDGWNGTLAVSLTSDAANACGQFAFDEDTTGQLEPSNDSSTGIMYDRMCLGSGAIPCDTTNSKVGPNDGASLHYPAAVANAPGPFLLGTSTPVMEIIERPEAFSTTATSTTYTIGFVNSGAAFGATMEVDPTSGCFFTASSSLPNWKAVCETAGASTIVDTGFASSTVLTGTGNFYRFRIETGANLVNFYIGTSSARMRNVATITTNIPKTGLVFTTQLSNIVGGFGKVIDISSIKLWFQEPALDY